MKCKVCDYGRATFVFSKTMVRQDFVDLIPEINYYYCAECGFLFSNMHDNFDDTLFSRWYGYPNYAKYDTCANKAHRVKRLHYMLDYVRAKFKKKEIRNVLIVGNGSANFNNVLEAFGDVKIDTTFSVVDGHKNVDPHNLKENYYDVVIAIEVLEHWTNIHAEFKRVWKCLNRDGVLIGTTGFSDRWKGKLSEWWYIDREDCRSAGHVSLYSTRTLFILAQIHSFKDYSEPWIPALRVVCSMPTSSGLVLMKKEVKNEN